MAYKFKALGLATIALLAMSAVVASAAQAQFTTNAAPTTVTATSALGNDVFVVDGSSVECAGHFEGTASETSVASITVILILTSCRAFGLASATVNMNGCDFFFHATGTVDISCPAGKAITITGGNCEVRIPGQTGLQKAVLSNHHPHIDAKLNLSGITANRTKDGFLCTLTGLGHVSNATLTQAATIHIEPKAGGNTISIE